MPLHPVSAELFRLLEDDLIAESGNLFSNLENAVCELESSLGLPENYASRNQDLKLPVDLDESKRKVAILMLHTSRLAYHLGHTIGAINKLYPTYVDHINSLQSTAPADVNAEAFAALTAFNDALTSNFPTPDPSVKPKGSTVVTTLLDKGARPRKVR